MSKKILPRKVKRVKRESKRSAPAVDWPGRYSCVGLVKPFALEPHKRHPDDTLENVEVGRGQVGNDSG